MRTEMRVRGQGGQGAITFGYVMGNAATIYEANMEAILTEAYGPEIKGGFARADVLFKDSTIDYPLVNNPEVLVVMSTEAWEAEKFNATQNAIVIYESRLCKIDTSEFPERTFIGIPALDMALEMKNKVVMNVIMMGVTQEITKIISKEALKKALLDRIPKRFEQLNIEALESGYKYAQDNIKRIN